MERAGYGWSEAPLTPGYDVQKVANLMVSLMETLGYKQYVAQGGDWGHLVAAHMAIIDAQRCLAIHLNMVPTRLLCSSTHGSQTGLIVN
jgi:pimeloyl-ACP methyl ester carboxylesterase